MRAGIAVLPALPAQPNFRGQISLPMSLSGVKMDGQVEMHQIMWWFVWVLGG